MNQSRSRIGFLAFIVLTALWTCTALAQQDSSFFFVQLADPQIGLYPFGKDFLKDRSNFEKAIRAVNRLHPAFVVICGDFVQHAENAKEISAFKDICSMLDPSIPLYLVPGNHDIGQRPSGKSLNRYRKNYGKDYYSFSRGGITFISLNSTLIKDPSGAEEAAHQQHQWFEETLNHAGENNSSVILFQHHPWFVKEKDEKGSKFNMPRNIRLQYLELFKTHGVTHVFSGHLHLNGVIESENITFITSGSVGMPFYVHPSGLRIVTVHGRKISHQYYALDEVPDKPE